MNIRRETLVTLGGLLAIVLLLGIGIYYVGETLSSDSGNNSSINQNNTSAPGLKRFVSADDFTQYLASARRLSSSSRQTSFALDAVGEERFFAESAPAPTADRVSQTNVQVRGIDEPDIVKTDGQRIYYSQESWYGFDAVRSSAEEERFIAPAPINATKVLNALPANAPTLVGDLAADGKMLLTDTHLIAFGNTNVQAFTVTDTEALPKQAWNMEYGENTSYVTARLHNDMLYLVTSTYLNTTLPCPISPLRLNAEELTIPCTDIFHPIAPTPVDTTYSVFAIDPETGEIARELSLAGLSGQSLIYVSPETLYLTYTFRNDWVLSYLETLIESGENLFPVSLQEKLKRLRTYDLSSDARLTELSTLIADHLSSLSTEQQEKFSKELSDSLSQGISENLRQWERTGIIAVDLERLQVRANGEVPGHPVQQFSLDEYNNTFRLATTSDASFLIPFSNERHTVNDVYILDADLQPLGSVLDLGLEGESIYGVRFVEDSAYVVTFLQTDPFYVLDLSDPKKPRTSGELKLPGYSSYLHPIAPDRILGIGQDEGRVKATLFDVSTPANPLELSTLQLDEFWSEALQNHHAFLQDPDHSVVFIPGSQGGHIISYTGDTLQLQKKIGSYSVQRALYIDNALYVLGTTTLIVVNEENWEEIATLTFGEENLQLQVLPTEPEIPVSLDDEIKPDSAGAGASGSAE